MLLRITALSLVLASAARAQCADWTPDFELTGLGLVHFDSTGNAAVVHDDGSGPALYIGGDFTGPPGVGIANLIRWDGAQWSSVGGGLGIGGQVNALLSFDDGSGPSLFVGGNLFIAGASGVARWDGSAWHGLPGIAGVVQVLTVHDDGGGDRLYAAGFFSIDGDPSGSKIARWDGGSWTVIGRPDSSVNALLSYDDGAGPALVAGGGFLSIDGQTMFRLGRYRAGAWEPFGPVSSQVLALASFDDGGGDALYVGGFFYEINGMSAPALAKWRDGAWSAVPGFQPDTSDRVSSLIVHDDGSGPSLFVGGHFSTVGGVSASRVARWDGSSWHALGSGMDEFDGPHDFVAWNDGSGLGLIAVGAFDVADDRPVDGVALWRDGAWSAIGEDRGVRGEVRALVRGDVGAGDQLFVGGEFDYAGGVRCNNVAVWDGVALTPVGGGMDDAVNSLCMYDAGTGARLYAGGAFDTAGTTIARGLAMWDGSTWTGIDVFGNVTAMCVHDDGSGPALFLVEADSSGGSAAIEKWNGSTLSTIAGANALSSQFEALTAIASYDDGAGSQLYAGGQFISIGGASVFYFARWNGSTWSAVGSGISAPYFNDHGVHALHVADFGSGPKLYVAGRFPSAGGVAVQNIAVWDGAWSALANASSTQPTFVRSLGSFDAGDGRGPSLYVGGRFAVSSPLVNRIARWDGAGYSPLGAGLTPVGGDDPIVAAIAAFDDGVDSGVDLYAGGSFDLADGTPSFGIARWQGCGETGATFCYGDGSATPCPCGNSSAVGERAGCLNSLGTGGTVRARGEPSIASDTLALDGAGMTNSSVLYFQGASRVNGGAGAVFGDGVACVGGPFVRLGSKTNIAGASSYPTAGDASISVKGFVTSAVTRHYSARYRNPAPFCTVDTFNYTNAVTIVWRP